MTITTENPSGAGFAIATFDLFRDIHKGIRAELFAVTSEAGSLDPADTGARIAVSEHVGRVVDLLVSHAAHEDAAIQPAIERHFPDLAARIATDHLVIDGRLVSLRELGETAAAARVDTRGWAHRLYIELASFTGAYLEHQDVEERTLMPALEQAVGLEAVMDMHNAIVSSIPPDEMARSLALMLPAMNADDRTEMLTGMRMSAPPEAFEGVWGLAGSVLRPEDHRALAARLGIDVD